MTGGRGVLWFWENEVSVGWNFVAGVCMSGLECCEVCVMWGVAESVESEWPSECFCDIGASTMMLAMCASNEDGDVMKKMRRMEWEWYTKENFKFEILKFPIHSIGHCILISVSI